MSRYDRTPPNRIATGPRLRILDALRREPGLCLVELQYATGFTWGRLHHHLTVLETFRVVVSVRVGLRRRHYAMDASVDPRVHAFSTHPFYRDLLLAVQARPGLTQGDCLRARPHRSRPTVASALDRLVRAGLVTTARQGRHRRYWPKPFPPHRTP